MGSPELDQIREQGWTETLFLVSEEDRADFARLANVVIGIALEDEDVREALTYVLNPGQASSERAGTFGLGTARNSEDVKVHLHTGFQSRIVADTIIPVRNQPADLRAYWDASHTMLDEVEKSTIHLLTALGARSLRPHILPPEISRRNVHLRTVRYTDAHRQPVDTEVVKGHGDLGLMTLHLYETHGHWFYGAPYPAELTNVPDSPDRQEAVREIRDELRLLEQTPDFAPFFLGVNWHTYPRVPKALRDLPAFYHAGFRPDPSEETISPYADRVIGDSDDRISVISFIHADGDELKHGMYVPAPVSSCRPKY